MLLENTVGQDFPTSGTLLHSRKVQNASSCGLSFSTATAIGLDIRHFSTWLQCALLEPFKHSSCIRTFACVTGNNGGVYFSACSATSPANRTRNPLEMAETCASHFSNKRNTCTNITDDVDANSVLHITHDVTHSEFVRASTFL